MKYVPHALGVTIAGLLLTIRGLVTENLTVNMIGDVIAVAGIVWLFYAWDKLMVHVKAEKRREREVDKLKKDQQDTDMIARAARMTATEAAKAAKSKGQNIKGQARIKNGEVFYIERKEA